VPDLNDNDFIMRVDLRNCLPFATFKVSRDQSTATIRVAPHFLRNCRLLVKLVNGTDGTVLNQQRHMIKVIEPQKKSSISQPKEEKTYAHLQNNPVVNATFSVVGKISSKALVKIGFSEKLDFPEPLDGFPLFEDTAKGWIVVKFKQKSEKIEGKK